MHFQLTRRFMLTGAWDNQQKTLIADSTGTIITSKFKLSAFRHLIATVGTSCMSDAELCAPDSTSTSIYITFSFSWRKIRNNFLVLLFTIIYAKNNESFGIIWRHFIESVPIIAFRRHRSPGPRQQTAATNFGIGHFQMQENRFSATQSDQESDAAVLCSIAQFSRIIILIIQIEPQFDNTATGRCRQRFCHSIQISAIVTWAARCVQRR